MIPSTGTALVIVVLAILPGAAYVWAFERQAGSYGVTVADRIFRLIAASTVVQVGVAPILYLLWRVGIRGHTWNFGQFLTAWAGALIAIGCPYIIGTALGMTWIHRFSPDELPKSLQRLGLGNSATRDRFLALLVGRDPAPTAWDAFFSQVPAARVRVLTKSSGRIVGVFGDGSYAGGFPNSKDLFLEDTYSIDEYGQLLDLRGVSVLLPESEIVAIEIVTS